MNRKTGATAIVPGSHKKVREIEERRREFDRTLYKDSPGHQARDQLMAEFRALPAADQGTRRPELFKRFQNLRNEYPDMLKLEQDAQEIRKNFFDPFTEAGLTPGIVNAKAGDLIIFDTGLYHGCVRTQAIRLIHPYILLIYLQLTKQLTLRTGASCHCL